MELNQAGISAGLADDKQPMHVAVRPLADTAQTLIHKNRQHTVCVDGNASKELPWAGYWCWPVIRVCRGVAVLTFSENPGRIKKAMQRAQARTSHALPSLPKSPCTVAVAGRLPVQIVRGAVSYRHGPTFELFLACGGILPSPPRHCAVNPAVAHHVSAVTGIGLLFLG